MSEFRHAYDVEASPSKAFRVIQEQDARIAALEAQLAELAAENERLKQRLANHQRDTNTVVSHETANVGDKPEGQQEPVTEALFEALKWFIDDIDGSHTKMVDFDENVAKARSALKAAMASTASASM